MEALIEAIQTTPIIDNHAHPLLIPSARDKYPLLSITTEAHGVAMRHATSTLSHLRAVNQLSEVLKCSPVWTEVVKAIDVERAKPNHEWEKRCFEGIETVLVDDGLDNEAEAYEYSWHDQLVRTECKRIVRIERTAEAIITELLKTPDLDSDDIFDGLRDAFDIVMRDAMEDPDIVGFKSVICYRTGLDIPPRVSTQEVKASFVGLIEDLKADDVQHLNRLDIPPVNAWLVHRAASIISKSPSPKKPMQFHTGLGDNDITLTKSSPSHLQQFIKRYPDLPIVLLHSSYPWTKEAGYLASVYENVYADIGEVFPFLSKEGQEKVVREILELTPTEKILWSTDGHWFPETYLLAVIQVREAFEVVFSEYVRDGTLTVQQAIRAVEDIFFNTSNDLYDLNLSMTSFPSRAILPTREQKAAVTASDFQTFPTFLQTNQGVNLIQLIWTDYTGLDRSRIVPVKRVLKMLENGPFQIDIPEAAFGLLPNDTLAPGASISGVYNLIADISTLLKGPGAGYASIRGFFYRDGIPSSICPRSTLQRVLAHSTENGLEYLIGFEIEVIFMNLDKNGEIHTIAALLGHNYCSSRAIQDPTTAAMLKEINDVLSSSSIFLEQLHVESSAGQYEFVLPPYPPLEAADKLLHTRQIISSIATKNGLHATLHPKPFTAAPSTASHAHISIASPHGNEKEVYESFYAGILKHMKSIIAFTYSKPASYDRMQDGCWAGGRWICWGTQNKETPLRKIVDSHFEFKCLDGLANVYLALAAILGAGTMGIIDKEKLVHGDCRRDPAQMSSEEREQLGIKEMLPADLGEALNALVNDEEMIEIMGNEVVDLYTRMKQAELKLYASMNAGQLLNFIMERY